jgi:hypothetical protein
MQIDTLFLRKIFDKKVFKIINSGFSVILYFCEKVKSHGFYPYGFGETEIVPFEVDSFEEYFALIEDSPSRKSK